MVFSQQIARISARPCWEQSRHPARGKGRWECEAQWSARAFGRHYALINELGNNAAGLPLPGADDGCGFTARQFASIKQSFEDVVDLGWQIVLTHLFIGPRDNARSELVGLRQLLHELHLIETNSQEEFSEFSEALFAEVAAAVEIVAALKVACSKMGLVFVDVPSKAARD